ncbi:MAG: protein kinase, partial [Pirellulaceae bacterium]|nr:protein kinase [Pirellulaceae bacterium]
MTFSEFPGIPEIELSNLPSQELLARWKLGDSQAANVLADRYFARLVALVASRLNRRYQPAVAPEEVVQSAMGSFFGGIATSQIRASRIHSVWSLLATFAKRKMLRAIEREKTIKRGGHLDRVPFDEHLFQQFEPNREAADQLQELLEELLDSQDDRSVAVLGAMLDGRTQQEIASELKVSDRTIRRCLEDIRNRLSESTRQTTEFADSKIPLVAYGHDSTKLPLWSYGQFILRRMIGQGAFGKVYEAVTQSDGSGIAVKFLKREFWQNSISRSMFLREVDQASKVSHPNVVRYLGWGSSPHGGPFIIQQFIDGQPLSQLRGSSPEQFREWLQEICDALNAIHQQGIIHGDLTPNNILIDRSNQAYLSDFGFSQSYRVGPHASVP